MQQSKALQAMHKQAKFTYYPTPPHTLSWFQSDPHFPSITNFTDSQCMDSDTSATDCKKCSPNLFNGNQSGKPTAALIVCVYGAKNSPASANEHQLAQILQKYRKWQNNSSHGPNKQTRLPFNLRPTTRECVHLVTRGYFRSGDKDGV